MKAAMIHGQSHMLLERAPSHMDAQSAGKRRVSVPHNNKKEKKKKTGQLAD